MKFFNLILFNIILLSAVFFIPQPALSESNQIENLLEQRIEILEEALRLARLRFQAGVGTLEDLGLIVPEILEVQLKMADRLGVENRKKNRVEAFKLALEDALQTEKDTKLLERAGLGTRRDVLLAESWRLDIQIQLEREKQALEEN